MQNGYLSYHNIESIFRPVYFCMQYAIFSYLHYIQTINSFLYPKMAGILDLKISTLNVNGIGESFKRKDTFNYLREKKHDIYFLQETHIKTELENYNKIMR